MDVWVERELAGCEFPDQRLGARLGKILTDLGRKIGATLPTACQDWAATKAAYRFFDNPRVDESMILAGHFAATRARIAAARGPILILHDTTEFSFQRERPDAIGKTRVLPSFRIGVPAFTKCGLLMHSSLAVTAAGKPPGLLAIKFWTRAVARASYDGPIARPPTTEIKSRIMTKISRRDMGPAPAEFDGTRKSATTKIEADAKRAWGHPKPASSSSLGYVVSRRNTDRRASRPAPRAGTIRTTELRADALLSYVGGFPRSPRRSPARATESREEVEFTAFMPTTAEPAAITRSRGSSPESGIASVELRPAKTKFERAAFHRRNFTF